MGEALESLAADALDLQAVEEALRTSVVVAVAFGSRADAESLRDSGEVASALMAGLGGAKG
ncbi:hypothetical protein D3C78_1562590 [compost metagenome]